LHEGDTNTLIHFSANDTIDFKTNGSERLRVVNAGVQLFSTLFTNGRTISVGDSASATDDRITLGDSQDLQIYHDGSNSFIDDAGTGQLRLRSNQLLIQNAAGNANQIICTESGAVDLHHDGSKKLETSSTGAKVTGNLEISSTVPTLTLTDTDGGSCYHEIKGPGNGDLRISCDVGDTSSGASEIQFDIHDSNKMLIKSSGEVQIPNDTGKLQLGASQDLQIYHDGSGSSIDNATGQLTIACDDAINLQSKTGAEYYFRGFLNNRAELYYDGSKKFETTSTGVLISGNIDAGTGNFLTDDNGKFFAGTAGDLEIFHDGAENFVQTNNGNLRIRNSAENMAMFFPNGKAELYFDNSSKLETTSTGASVSGSLGIGTTSPSTALHINMASGGLPKVRLQHSSTGNDTFEITGGLTGVSNSGFGIYDVDESAYRLVIDSSGNVGIGTTSPSAKLEIETATTSETPLTIGAAFSTTMIPIASFVMSGTERGSIKASVSGTQFNTSSDYRLKENVTAITDGIIRLKTLKPYRFNFKADASTTVDGFFAHEVTAVPEAITGTKDEVDADNKPIYQGIDQSKLVPLLVAAVQELIGKVEALEAS